MIGGRWVNTRSYFWTRRAWDQHRQRRRWGLVMPEDQPTGGTADLARRWTTQEECDNKENGEPNPLRAHIAPTAIATFVSPRRTDETDVRPNQCIVTRGRAAECRARCRMAPGTSAAAAHPANQLCEKRSQEGRPLATTYRVRLHQGIVVYDREGSGGRRRASRGVRAPQSRM